MSCLARERFAYHVVGILEKAFCENELDCREDGLKIFSTTVVFDKNGQIIAKYGIAIFLIYCKLISMFCFDLQI